MARRMLLVAGGAVGVVLVVGCSAGTPEAGSTEASTTTSASGTTTPPSVSSTAVATSEEVDVAQTESSEPAACEAADLAIAKGKGGVGGGSAYYTLRFTNSSDDTCTMTGFPTVSMVTAENGVRIGGPSGTCDENSSCGSEEVALVTLAPGGVAHAKVQQANGGNFDPDECDPQPVGGLVVSPPDDTSSVFVTAGGTGCANPEIGLIQVGAITSGPGEG